MNGNLCPKCGLPWDLCTCEVREREEKRISVHTTTRKYRKPVTIIEGVDKDQGKDITKQLKRKLACGGSFKEGHIELQGDHKSKIKEILVKMGFDGDQINVN
jgi:translation initiation factor 1